MLAALMLAGCTSASVDQSSPSGGSSSPITVGSDPAADVYDSDLAVSLRGRSSIGTRARWFKSVGDALPSKRNRAEYGDSGTDAVIVGKVVGAEAGFAFIDNYDPGPGDLASTRVEFAANAADWRTIHVRVEITETLHGSVDGLGEVLVGLSIPGSVDGAQAIADAAVLGHVVAFLDRGSPVFAYDQSLFAVVGDGGLIATVERGSGRYRFPFLDPLLASPLSDDAALTARLTR